MPDRQAGRLRHGLHEVEHRVDVVEDLVPTRRRAVLALRDATDLGDLPADLLAGEHPAEAGLGALAELDLDRLHRRRLDEVHESPHVEATVLVAAAEVGRADLEDDVTAVAVVRRECALAGVLQAARHRRALVERLDRLARQRTEAHPGDVDHRAGSEGVRTSSCPAQHLGGGQHDLLLRVRHRRRPVPGERAVLDDRIAGGVLDVVVGAEAEVVVLQLGAGIDPAALVTAEGTLLVVAGDDVLPQLGSELLGHEPGVTDDREVAQDGVLALDQVVDRRGSPGSGRPPEDGVSPLHGLFLVPR